MLKRDEVTTPNSCWNKARDDEPVFVLLARDAAAADTLRFWTKLRVSLGKNRPEDAQITEAIADADRMALSQGRINYRPHGGGMAGHDDDEPFAPATADTVVSVLHRYTTFVLRQPLAIREQVAVALNEHLDALLRADVLGSEGQDDPRGDHRESLAAL